MPTTLSKAQPSNRRDRRRPATRRGRVGLAAAVGALVLGVGGCGFGVQTLKEYNQAEGANANAGDVQAGSGVKLRNLMILVDPGSEKAVLSGSLIAYRGDTLTGITGHARRADGQPAGSLVIKPPAQAELKPGTLLVLTDGPAVAVGGVKLTPGLSATVTFEFARAGSVTTVVPIVDRTKPDYASFSPQPEPTPS